ncbi:DUF5753 domain-containing protein [Nocardia huaxiensis]|uniref:XRE family transcriptional regulator n=1 Tax=Nocardia huaxiensis TaxID=2755382 RepID=A0A7D6ZMU6_9NOCA|nr:DUF5753 domain-containing protein [Nocardia huaxiensis]QLY31183.1 XRE family transcriptional regulator [Nocardia huaxiensis]UFS94712.1 DUF5753 domain-containing protein [Nocardia huaxiensis]
MDFGNFMKGLREKAPHPAQGAAALHLEISRQVIIRLEEGTPTKLGTIHIRSLLDFYEATPDERTAALALWQEVRDQDKTAKAQGNSKGFWKAYSDQVAPNFPKFLRLEGAADRIFSHQLVIVPGMLQTPDYRRAIIRMTEPGLSAVDVERRVELTARRQTRLDERDFSLNVVLSEAVLRHQPGVPSVMAAQLRSMIEVGERDNVSIRVVPYSVGPHAGLAILAFTLLGFPKGASGLSLPPVVFVEGAIGSMFHEHADEVGQYQQAIDGLRAVALTEQGTRELLLQVAKEYAA